MAMTWAIRHGPITTTEKLLDACVDIANNDLNFILNMAVEHNRVDAIKLLLHRGFDPNMGNRMQQTALHHAAVCDNVEIAQILLDAGVNVDSWDCDYGRADLDCDLPLIMGHFLFPMEALGA